MRVSGQSVQFLQTYTGRNYALLSGRAATGLWALLKAWDLHDQVILLPANTCYIVLWAVLKSGNRPLLVDVDRTTGNVTVEGLTAHLDAHAAVVIPCHMYGLPAPIQSICEWAKAYDVKVIEDAALALGTTVDGQPAGSWGDASILSFGLGKIADNQVGGAVLTNDSQLATDVRKYLDQAPLWDDRLMSLTNQWNGLYWTLHQYESQNPRLLDLYPQLFEMYGELTAYQLSDEDWADLPALLDNLPQNVAHRIHMASLYTEQLDAAKAIEPSVFSSPFKQPSNTSLWRYPLLVRPDVRDELLSYLWEQGIHEATRWYPPLRPMTTALAPDTPQPLTPVADELGASIINLPVDETVDADTVREIVSYIEDFLIDLEPHL